MKLVTGDPFWPRKDPVENHYSTLQKDLETEVVVVGGGVTSALVCLAFHEAGIPVALVSDGCLGMGSTCASTALLQYEIDENLVDLMDETGRPGAVRAYRLCGHAIDRVAEICRRFPADFAYRPSIYLAAKRADVKKLREEYEVRKAVGFQVEWLDAERLEQDFGFRAPAAIYSKLGGEVDPFKLTQGIFAHLQTAGVEIYEQTGIDCSQRDGQRLITKTGHHIRAKQAVFASGYKSQAYLKEKVVDLRSTYAFVTDRQAGQALWPQKALWWDSADPYIYARTTADNRMMFGGGDKPFWQSWRRMRAHQRQVQAVAKKARSYYPGVDWRIEYSWNGVFGETKDGLAYIGQPDEWKNAWFALGFGGNGITYSQLAADYLPKVYRGEEIEDLALFRFGR